MARGRLQACTSKTLRQVSLRKHNTLKLTSQEAQQGQWRVPAEVAAAKPEDQVSGSPADCGPNMHINNATLIESQQE